MLLTSAQTLKVYMVAAGLIASSGLPSCPALSV